ncbi:CTL-like protein 2 [Scaptodrosophila lebanonensis]|uniref:Choline transporter-like protein n=1 Tax=Drosophila lebanonensis TaxID=7225 RepID=A0A6J2T4B8_DROLE|nr:CTL-like protein 2 [Scaptodrosophila lebanonensis]XP_030369733.1 CTL-like protein 2 [Scaptodrosophila lebanonensis]XP_030369734.1 CTL-like protein 2 [Scaptodrosophila lebanonensis]
MAESRELVNKYGERLPYDRNFRGPFNRNRSCTDLGCLFIFVLFLGGWAYVSLYAYRHGDLNSLMVPTDMFNQKCGIDSGVLSKNNLFFFDLEKCIDPLVPLTGCDTPQVCIESCPIEDFDWNTMRYKYSLEDLRNRMICLNDNIKNSLWTIQDMQNAISRNECVARYTKSRAFLNRCMFDFEICQRFKRSPRDLLALTGSNATKEPESLQRPTALSLSMSEQQQRVAQLSNLPVEKRALECEKRTQNGAVIKEKMMQANTKLVKFVGNLVAHFYNGTHDAQRLGEEIVEDIINSWQIVLVVLICTLVTAFIYIALMRWLSGPIVWFSIFGVLIGLVVGIYYSIKKYSFWSQTATTPHHSLNLQSTLLNILQDRRTWLYLSIFLCACFVIILLLVIVLRQRIRIAIALTKEGSNAVSSVTSTMFFPIFSWLLYIAAIGFSVAVGLYLASIGKPKFLMVRRVIDQNVVTNENCICEGPAVNYSVGTACEPSTFQEYCYIPSPQALRSRARCMDTTCSFVTIENPPFVQWSIVYNIFGFFWMSFFISAFFDMVLAATFANWYWTFKKRDVPYFTLTRALFQTIFYHLGTLAFGSLILTICRMIRLILEYIHKKLKKFDNPVTRAILCCMRCFFWLLENFLKFLNRNAYIMCAIHGTNFCTSAKDSFNLIMRNFLRVITLDQVTDFLFFLSKVLLTAGAGAATYYFVGNNPAIIQVHYKAVPTTVVVIASYLMTSVFFGVYSMAVDTLFLCFLEDCERNDGTPEKPYFMSTQLRKILGKKNKLLPRERRSQ